MQDFELSIIMVPYKCRDVFRTALSAVLESRTQFNFEVIVIDNDSRDGTAEMVKSEFQTRETWKNKIILYRNTNEGFPKANNRGLAMRRGKYALLLNPDTKVSSDTLQVMMDFMKAHTEVGISTCKLVKGDGALDKACRRTMPTPWVALARLSGLSLVFPKSKLFAKYNLTYKSEDEGMEIDACVGAFMFVSPKCLEAIGSMDERFYMYGEDLDWCMAAKCKGYKVYYYPKTTTVHFKGQSSKVADVSALYAFHHAMWLFYKKHFARKYFHILDIVVWFGISLRFVVKLTLNSFRKDPYVSR